jgi:hypothetical protein
VLNEQSIKAAVVDRLFRSGALDNAVLINEMVYANWSRRADLAVANGHLHAFEIKSDVDSLRRLDGQISIYLERFDKVTLVVSSKFVRQVLEMTPDRVAVWEAIEESEDVRIKVVRAGRTEDVGDRAVLIDYLLREELYRFLVERGLPVTVRHTRARLVQLASSQPLSALRSYVLKSLKARYYASFQAFSSARTKTTSADNLSVLRRRNPTIVRESFTTSLPTPIKRVRKVGLDLSRLFPDGEIPDGVPKYILVRDKVPRRR